VGTCWAIKPLSDTGSEGFNLVGTMSDSGPGYGINVTGIQVWRYWSKNAAQARCGDAGVGQGSTCPQINEETATLSSTLFDLRLTLYRPVRVHYPAGRGYQAGSYSYFSRLSVYSFRQHKKVILGWSWKRDRYTHVSGGLAGLQL
jgi:hypothetical protein